jgi:hypothetical protein
MPPNVFQSRTGGTAMPAWQRDEEDEGTWERSVDQFSVQADDGDEDEDDDWDDDEEWDWEDEDDDWDDEDDEDDRDDE